MPLYARLNTPTPEIIDDVITYGRIVCVLSPGLFIESVLTKVIQGGRRHENAYDSSGYRRGYKHNS